MQAPSLLRSALVAGFAVFSMFFGSGNLVFPLVSGMESAQNAGMAALGLILTGVLVPLMGLMSVLISSKSQEAFFQQLGKKTGFAIVALILLLLGPLGVCARCTLVAFGGFQLLFADMSLWFFNAIFVGLTALILLKDQRAVNVIGKYLTPLLLGGIISVYVWSFQIPDPQIPASNLSSFGALKAGLLAGYQTMDLMAALFFAFTIREFFAHQHVQRSYYEMRRYKFQAAFLGIALLAMVYAMLIHLGAKFSGQLLDVPPERMIVKISDLVLGRYAKPVVATTVFLACLTTMIVLVKIFAEFLKGRILKDKISFTDAVILTCVGTFITAMLGFETLSLCLGFLLQFIYPALMAFALFSLVYKLTGHNGIRWGFWVVLVVSIAIYILNH